MENKMKRVSTRGKRKLFGFISVLLVVCLLVFLSSCAADVEEEDSSCMGRLDNREFASVAADTSCSNYERGSAELGLAGFLFENFMASEASDNFPAVFGLTRTGCDTTGDNALGLLAPQSYSSEYQKHFLNAQYYTRDLPAVRSTAEIEISLFATLGELVVQTSCEMDASLDGEITEDDNLAFSKIDIAGAGVGTSDLSGDGSIIQAYYSNTSYLLDTTNSLCREDVSFDGVWNNIKLNCDSSHDSIMLDILNWDSASVIIAVESLQQLFDPSADANDILKPFSFLSMFATKSGQLSTDLISLGIQSGDDLYDSINEPIANMDNGGTCSNDSVQVLDLLTTIVQNAWAKDTSTDTTYRSRNTISLIDIDNVDGTLGDVCDATCDTFIANGKDFNARLIFKSGSGYTPIYRTADDNIKNTLANLATLTLVDPTADPPELRSISANDGIIALKEILCAE